MNKYHSNKITIDGETFDSRREAKRWEELKLLERAGEIQDLRRQVKFELIPSQKVNGKVAERACTYVADFVYTENGNTVVEDSKGFRTDTYKIKRKLMLYVHNVQIRET